MVEVEIVLLRRRRWEVEVVTYKGYGDDEVKNR